MSDCTHLQTSAQSDIVTSSRETVEIPRAEYDRLIRLKQHVQRLRRQSISVAQLASDALGMDRVQTKSERERD